MEESAASAAREAAARKAAAKEAAEREAVEKAAADLNVSVPDLNVSASPYLQEPCAKLRGFVNMTRGLSDYLAAHAQLDHAAALGLSLPFKTAGLEQLGLPLGLPGSVQLAALLYNSTSIHALPTLVASLYNATLSRATGGTQSIAAAAHALSSPLGGVRAAPRGVQRGLVFPLLHRQRGLDERETPGVLLPRLAQGRQAHLLPELGERIRDGHLNERAFSSRPSPLHAPVA